MSLESWCILLWGSSFLLLFLRSDIKEIFEITKETFDEGFPRGFCHLVFLTIILPFTLPFTLANILNKWL